MYDYSQQIASAGQTHMMPMNHRQQLAMAASKSSVGEDISSSFVSSSSNARPHGYEEDGSDVTSVLTSSYTDQHSQRAGLPGGVPISQL